MEDKFLIPVSEKAVAHGFNVGVGVYHDKLNFPDKWHIGGANELQADIYGFIAESVVCEFFGYPMPVLTKGKNDAFDLVIAGKKVDVKKIGYSKLNRKTKITINKKQYLRKKHLIDVFLFCTFNGSFLQVPVEVDEHGHKKFYKVFMPTGGLCELWLIGWIDSPDVEKVAKTYVWKDKQGNPTGESFRLFEDNLKPVEELIN